MSNLNQFLTNGSLVFTPFSVSGNYTVPQGVYIIWISGVGAGGGATAGAVHSGTSTAAGGIGGNSGAAAIMVPMFVTPGQVIPIVVGVGGLGGTGSDISTNGVILSTGQDGTETRVGDLVLAPGRGAISSIQDRGGKIPLDIDDQATSTGMLINGARTGQSSLYPPGVAGVLGYTGKQGGSAGAGSAFAPGGDAGDGGQIGLPAGDGLAGSKGSGGGGGGASIAGQMSGDGGPGGDGYVVIGAAA